MSDQATNAHGPSCAADTHVPLPAAETHGPFRAVAVERYRSRRAEAATLVLGLPRTAPLVAIIGVLLLGCLAIGCLVRVPVYVSGLAVVVDSTGTDAPTGVMVAALLPADSLPRVQPGQPIYLQMGADGERWRQTLTRVEPAVLSPDAIQHRLGLGPLSRGAVVMLGGPAVIAFAPLDASSAPFEASAYLGSVLSARVEIGSRPIVGLVPPFDGLLKDA